MTHAKRWTLSRQPLWGCGWCGQEQVAAQLVQYPDGTGVMTRPRQPRLAVKDLPDQAQAPLAGGAGRCLAPAANLSKVRSNRWCVGSAASDRAGKQEAGQLGEGIRQAADAAG
jgi:hypothetical protein